MILLRFLILTSFLFLTGCPEPATPEESEPGQKLSEYRLTLGNSHTTEPFSKPYANWQNSLIQNLGIQRSKIRLEQFLVTDLTLLKDGQDSGHPVYASRSHPDCFFLPDLHLVIDFNEKEVGTGGTGGMSIHLTDDRKYGVAIHPGGSRNFIGVPLGDPKTDSPAPDFSQARSVIFLR